MAIHNVAAGAVGTYNHTLSAGVVDSVGFATDPNVIEVISDGAAAIYVTVDGSAPTVGGANTYVLPALPCSRKIRHVGNQAVKLISAGTPVYGVGVTSGDAGLSLGSSPSVESGSVLAAAPTGVAATDTANLLAAIALTITRFGAQGGPVYLRPGTYVLTSTGTLTLPSSGSLNGAGSGGRFASVFNGVTIIDATAMVAAAAVKLYAPTAGQGQKVQGIYFKGQTTAGGSRVGGAIAIDISSSYTAVVRDCFFTGFTQQIVAQYAQQFLIDNCFGFNHCTHGLVAVGSSDFTVRDSSLSNGGAGLGNLAGHDAANYLFDGCSNFEVSAVMWDESVGPPNVKIVGVSRNILLRGTALYSNNSPNVTGIVVGDGTNAVRGLRISGFDIRPYNPSNVPTTKGIDIKANVIGAVLEDIVTHTADDSYLGWYSPGNDIVDAGTDTVYRNVNGQSSVATKATAPSSTDFDGLPVGVAAGGLLDLADGRLYFRLPDGVVRYAALNGVAPVNTVAPAATPGIAAVGDTLTCSTGGWQNYPTGYTYQWKRAGVNISGATSSTYLLDGADASVAVKCTVTATNATGSTPHDSNIVTPTAGPFAPDDLTGLQVWLKDTGLAGADGAGLAAWTNEGVGAATYAASFSQPIKKVAVLGGKDAARFVAASSQQFSGGDLSALFPTAATLFVVYKPTNSTHGVYDAGAADAFWSFSGAGYMGAFRATRVNTYPAAMPTTGNHYVSVRSSASAYQVWKDGVAQTAQAANYAAGTSHVLGGSASPFDGDVAEVLIYDSALSGGDMDSVHAYLAARFGI